MPPPQPHRKTTSHRHAHVHGAGNIPWERWAGHVPVFVWYVVDWRHNVCVVFGEVSVWDEKYRIASLHQKGQLHRQTLGPNLLRRARPHRTTTRNKAVRAHNRARRFAAQILQWPVQPRKPWFEKHIARHVSHKKTGSIQGDKWAEESRPDTAGK